MFKNFYKLGLLCLISFSIIYYSCRGGSGSQEGEEDAVIVPTENGVSVTAPTTLKVFIDASGSMRDYFGDQNISNITAALSGLNQAVENLEAEYYVWGDETKKISTDELTERLIKKSLNGKASSFDKIFEKMTQMAGRDTLTVLLSDGIISSASRATNQSKRFTDYDKGILTTNIQKSLTGKNKAVSIYRMKGDFKGRYFDKGNNGISYKGERPFFVFVLGNPDNVRFFDSQVRKGKIADIYKNAEAVYLGSVPKARFLIEPADGNDKMASKEDFDREEGTNDWQYSGTLGFRISAEIPKWIRESYSDAIIKRMSNVEFDGKPEKVNIMIDGDYLMFDVPEKTVERLQENQRKWIIKYSMTDPALKDWEQYSTDDDTTPDTDHTYLLEDLIQSLHKGITGNKDNLLEAEIIIKPQ